MEHAFGGKGLSWRIALTCVALWAWSAAAHASTAVVVPPSIDVAASVDVVDGATAELTRVIRVHGFDVISSGQAAAAAEDAQQTGSFAKEHNPNDCRSATCATEYRRLFDAAFAVQMRLLGSGGKVGGVVITITESPTATFSASSVVHGGDVKGAIQAAYAAAREKHVRGEGPWLSVEGSPAGAVVYFDGLEYGSLPFERRYVEGGAHRVEVRKDGFITQGFQLEIPNRIDHEERLQVKLAPLAGAMPVAERRIDRTWDYVLGGLVMAAGGAHLAMGIQQRLKAGDCAERDDGGDCTSVYGSKSGTKENVLLGVGAAGVAAGAILIWAAPIGRVRLHADRQSASLSIGGGF
jgi:hypothetical protein